MRKALSNLPGSKSTNTDDGLQVFASMIDKKNTNSLPQERGIPKMTQIEAFKRTAKVYILKKKI
jgi:hypothetical protein